MSDTERELPGPGSITDLRRVASLDGSEITEGKPYIDLPAWFTRLGRSHFRVDTGFGPATIKVVAADDATLAGFFRHDPNSCKKMLASLVSLPTWKAEADINLDKDWALKEGDVLPTPAEVASRSPQVCAKYVGECLPISFIQQVVAGFRFMLLPPIAFTKADSD
jgi:hypothetical protein